MPPLTRSAARAMATAASIPAPPTARPKPARKTPARKAPAKKKVAMKVQSPPREPKPTPQEQRALVAVVRAVENPQDQCAQQQAAIEIAKVEKMPPKSKFWEPFRKPAAEIARILKNPTMWNRVRTSAGAMARKTKNGIKRIARHPYTWWGAQAALALAMRNENVTRVTACSLLLQAGAFELLWPHLTRMVEISMEKRPRMTMLALLALAGSSYYYVTHAPREILRRFPLNLAAVRGRRRAKARANLQEREFIGNQRLMQNMVTRGQKINWSTNA